MSYRTNGTDGATDPPTKPSWRGVLPIHPAAELFPLMSEPELRELANDIKKNGLQEQPVFYRDPKLGLCALDGRNRLDACELIGRETVYSSGTPRVGVIREWSSSFDPVDFVLTKNLYRRHLTAEQRRELIAKVLKAKPATSNRQIAGIVKADDKTVAKVRTELEATAEIPQLKKTTGKDGKARPAKGNGGAISFLLASRSRKPASPSDWKSDDVSPERRQAEHSALDSPEEKAEAADHNGAGTKIERDWCKAERALEALTAHSLAQVASAIPPERAALVREIADYFTALAARLTTRPNGNGEAPVASADSTPDDLSIPHFLQRGAS